MTRPRNLGFSLPISPPPPAQVREVLVSWLNYMTRPRNLGFFSMRFDFARGYNPKYLKEYVDSTGVVGVDAV